MVVYPNSAQPVTFKYSFWCEIVFVIVTVGKQSQLLVVLTKDLGWSLTIIFGSSQQLTCGQVVRNNPSKVFHHMHLMQFQGHPIINL